MATASATTTGATSAPPIAPPAKHSVHDKLAKKPSKAGLLIFGLVLVGGLIFIGSSIARDLSGTPLLATWPYILLGIALLTALGFEFVNGFHDTANAVATVIYTHSLDPQIAVVWSGAWNFAGVVTSTGAVAFGIVSLLPVELILQVGSGAGFAMVFALLIAAILWNLGTWWFGLPASSSHTLIGSIIGVGIANQLMNARTGTSGVDWAQAANIGKSLLLSPIFGFAMAAGLFMVLKAVVKNKKLYEAPEGTEPPPFWIRGLLILTCTGVSFFHGSNDGQKGMGLIMLILIGTVPTTYALNHAVTPSQTQDFIAVSTQTADTLGKYVQQSAAIGDPREDVTDYIRTKEFKPNTMLALRELVNGIGTEMAIFKDLKNVPQERSKKLPQRHVFGERSDTPDAKVRQARFCRSRRCRPEELQIARGSRHALYPALGQSGHRASPGPRHHGRMEAHRRNRRRENRQEPPDVRSGRSGRNHRYGHDRRGRLVRFARQYHARVVLGHRRNHGRQSLRSARGNDTSPGDGLDTNAPSRHDAIGIPVLLLPPGLLDLAHPNRLARIARCLSESGQFSFSAPAPVKRLHYIAGPRPAAHQVRLDFRFLFAIVAP